MRVRFPGGLVINYPEAMSVDYHDKFFILWKSPLGKKRSDNDWVATIMASSGAIIESDSTKARARMVKA